jgi:hypothetical protein
MVTGTMAVSVLFEFKGLRKELTCSPTDICSRLEKELLAMGTENAKVDLCGVKQPGGDYLVQRFCSKWNCFVNMDDSKEVRDGDKLSYLQSSDIQGTLLTRSVYCM